ncbi:hypothetical protein F2Q70_00006895 [Brassica cretica]|uniref:Uncharacterized protein n=1 Tax=Brassica cretica TaxID=69181 RepID=A0A8S9G8R6_BRACR|nr:hypothetical protein F2Q68_00023569 [Brassica cretica]KAF2572521.1 hypothetical protein F2Q70_00006895 [Brassica cretica]
MENMKLRRAKEADQDICAIKILYLTNQEEFIHETGFAGFYTQQEHAANWFHIKRINGLENMSFSNQGWPDLPYLEDQWFISCKPNIGDQEIYLCNQETHPRIQKSQAWFVSPDCIDKSPGRQCLVCN